MEEAQLLLCLILESIEEKISPIDVISVQKSEFVLKNVLQSSEWKYGLLNWLILSSEHIRWSNTLRNLYIFIKTHLQQKML